MSSRQLFLLYNAEVGTGHGIWRIWANFFLLVIELAIKGHKSERGRTVEEKGHAQNFKGSEHLIGGEWNRLGSLIFGVHRQIFLNAKKHLYWNKIDPYPWRNDLFLSAKIWYIWKVRMDKSCLWCVLPLTLGAPTPSHQQRAQAVCYSVRWVWDTFLSQVYLPGGRWDFSILCSQNIQAHLTRVTF